MGCDIHIVLEERDGEKWVATDTFQGHHKAWVKDGEYDWATPTAVSRNYARFAKLAGVRGEGPIARGIPDDLSQTTRFLIKDWGSDGHSHSWMSLEEAVPIFLETLNPQPKPDDFKAKFPASYFFGVSGEPVNHRIVFWFDN